MGIYLHTTKTISKPIGYFYRCSNCGKVVSQSAYVNGSANYDRRGSRGEINEERARQTADQRSDKAVGQAMKKAELGDYRPLQLDKKCPNCQHREPWQRMKKPAALLIIFIFCMVFGLLIFPMGISSQDEAGMRMKIVGGGLLAVAGILMLIVYLRGKKLHDLTQRLPEESRPHLYLPGDKNAAAAALMKTGFRQEEQIVRGF